MVGAGKLSTTELVRSSLTFTLIESVGQEGSAEDLEQCEEMWRNRLNSWAPNGLYMKEDGPQSMRKNKLSTMVNNNSSSLSNQQTKLTVRLLISDSTGHREIVNATQYCKMKTEYGPV